MARTNGVAVAATRSLLMSMVSYAHIGAEYLALLYIMLLCISRPLVSGQVDNAPIFRLIAEISLATTHRGLSH
jgi:hypothetical protein